MDRQKLFDTFVRLVDGKGRGINRYGDCAYAPRDHDHPGCAIGCQPGFRDVAPDADGNIEDVIKEYPVIVSLFNIKNEDDMQYLMDLQILHDRWHNWDGPRLRPSAIQDFADRHGLKYPR